MKKQDKLTIQTQCGALAVEFISETGKPIVVWRKRRQERRQLTDRSLLDESSLTGINLSKSIIRN